MDNQKILTISVAAYNVEETLSKTLESMYDKRIEDDLEVLIIDDGSKDNTEKIAKEYEKKSPKIFRYIKKKNGGHGSTINKGIELAQGKYFKVVDGDDWVNTEALVAFINKLKYINSDLILTDFMEIYPNKKNKVNLIQNMQPGKEYSWKDKINVEKVVLHTVTVKTNLLRKNHVYITEKCFYVDVEFVVWAAYVSHTITYLNIYLYMYRLGEANQSVAKSNMLKNVKMQERVSYQLVKMYDQFIKSNSMVSNQKETIFNTLKRSIGSTMRTYLLMSTQVSKEKIKSFDNNIKKISLYTYNELNNEAFIKLTRCLGYSLIPLIRISYRVWILKYKY